MSDKIINLTGATPKFIDIAPERVNEIRRETLFGTITSITERVEIWVTEAKGMTIGPFATKENAAKHGLPREAKITRIRYEREGKPVPGCAARNQLDENCCHQIKERSQIAVA